MIRAAFLALAAALALPASALPAGAVSVPNGQTVAFVAVDSVQVVDQYVVVTGVVDGEAAATARSVTFDLSSGGATAVQNHESCQRLALTALERPGRYRLELTQGRGNYGGGPPYVSSCRLVRTTP
jgi:hypothetical protein